MSKNFLIAEDERNKGLLQLVKVNFDDKEESLRSAWLNAGWVWGPPALASLVGRGPALRMAVGVGCFFGFAIQSAILNSNYKKICQISPRFWYITVTDDAFKRLELRAEGQESIISLAITDNAFARFKSRVIRKGSVADVIPDIALARDKWDENNKDY